MDDTNDELAGLRRFRTRVGRKAEVLKSADVKHDLAILDLEIAYLERFVAKLKTFAK
jgi:hypothetical protein